MVGSALGKRSRTSTGTQVEQCGVVTRAKRRQLVVGNDEAENPFITRKKKTARAIDVYEDKDEEPNVTSESRSAKTKGQDVSANHAAVGRTRSTSTPSKINAHFKASKTSASELNDNENKPLPHTPRHRDALLKGNPITPKHFVAGTFTVPLTPQTPTTPAAQLSVPSVFNDARQLFTRNSRGASIVGREAERLELKNFITSRVSSKKSGCVYVSGPPGTGKSALANEVCESLGGTDLVRMSYINCMSVKTVKDMSAKLWEDLCDDSEELEGSPLQCLKNLFFTSESTLVVTLDEIDELLGVDLEFLYNLFDWALDESSDLVLIAIANRLDFTQRFLPRLKNRNLPVQLLPFMPYTDCQIAEVIKSKLQSLVSPEDLPSKDFTPFMQPPAIQLIARKVATQQGGDLRKAFDICRSAIEKVEAETKADHLRKTAELTPQTTPTKTPLVENLNLSSPVKPRSPTKAPRSSYRAALAASMATLTPANAPRATIAHVARITSTIMGNGASQRLLKLNLQQKAVLCALAALEKKNRAAAAATCVVPSTPSKRANAAAPTIRSLFATYAGLCRRGDALHALSNTEFRDVVASLETLGLLSAVEAKGGLFSVPATPSKRGRGGGFASAVVEDKRVASVVGEAELLASLDGVGSEILKDMLAEKLFF